MSVLNRTTYWAVSAGVGSVTWSKTRRDCTSEITRTGRGAGNEIVAQSEFAALWKPNVGNISLTDSYFSSLALRILFPLSLATVRLPETYKHWIANSLAQTTQCLSPNPKKADLFLRPHSPQWSVELNWQLSKICSISIKHVSLPCTSSRTFRVELMDSVGYQAEQDIMEPLSLYLTRLSVNTLFTLSFAYLMRRICDSAGMCLLFLYHSMWTPAWPDTRHVRFTELVRFSSTVPLGGLTRGTLPTTKWQVTFTFIFFEGQSTGHCLSNKKYPRFALFHLSAAGGAPSSKKCTNILKLKLDNGLEVDDPDSILKEQANYSKSLYSSNNDNVENPIYDVFFQTDFISPLREENTNVCEGRISKEECGKALPEMENCKSPGSDLDGFHPRILQIFLERHRRWRRNDR